MLSAEGSPWLIHDDTLERTSNGSGRVGQATDVVLQGLDAGAHLHPAFSGEPLPRLEAAARVCRELGLCANVEIKPARGCEVISGDVVARRVLELWAGNSLPLVSSFSEVALQAARAVAPQLPLALLCEKPPVDWPDRLDELGAYSLHCAAEWVDGSLLALAQSRGTPVLCWTVNDRRQAESLFSQGVTSVISDRIDLLLGV